MSTIAQLFLIVVVSVLTFFAAVAGIQVFQILFEVRQLLKKLNRVADNTAVLSNSAAKPVTAVNEFFTDVRSLVRNTQDEIIDSVPDKVITPATDRQYRRFFHRSSATLRPS